MKQRIISIAIITAALLLAGSPSHAADSKADTPQAPASGAKSSAKAARSEIAAKRKEAAKVKQMNINAATREELKTLPGIGDVEADKIIAGRPYGSKAWLVSKKILSAEQTTLIKDLVFAGKPFPKGAKNPVLNPAKK
ncbi:MAG: hypothetical protein WCH44_07915 [Betaproteobacteria bacterium]